jgi:hypothetical protein
VIQAAGVGYEAKSAKDVSETQVEAIDGFVAAGARVLIVAPVSDGSSLPAIQRAIKAGIPVLTIRNPNAGSLYVGFDPGGTSSAVWTRAWLPWSCHRHVVWGRFRPGRLPRKANPEPG